MTLTKFTDIDLLNTNIRTVLENDQQYIELTQNIETAIAESSAIVVLTESDVATAANFIVNYKKIEKEIEKVRKELVQPLVDKKAEIDAFFKSIPFRFEDELKRLNTEVLDFKRKAEAEARAKADVERKLLEEIAINDAIAKGLDEPAIVPEVIPQTKKISEMNTSKVHTRKTKSFKIINENLIPREYLTVDEQKIRAERMKFDFEAKSNIPGVEFTFNESVV